MTRPVRPGLPRCRPPGGGTGAAGLVLAACAVVLVLTMTLGVGVGSVPLSPVAVWRVVAGGLAGHPENSVAGIIVWQIRLPQVLLAAVVGAALTTAGSVVQVLVRNAPADPFLVGVSSGASVGATAVLLLGAFASPAPTQLILCGVVLSALFESVTSLLIFRGNPQAT